ncbi:MAG: glycoside hydrolase family 3 N-terminal domain-containing protein [Victivallales bacterium]
MESIFKNQLSSSKPLPVEQRVASLLAAMTVDEKIRQIDMFPFFPVLWKKGVGPVLSEAAPIAIDDNGGNESSLPPEHRSVQPSKGRFSAARLKEILGDMAPGLVRELEYEPDSARMCNLIQRYMLVNTRLGIPVLFTGDALNGHRFHGATTFPQMIGLGATWNAELLCDIGKAMAREARADGLTVLRTPVLDLARDPRWGRCGESFGEDPWLAARLGVAIIQGMQGNLSAENVVAEIKHFVHGTPEGGHNICGAQCGERELRSVYLPPFQAAVEEAGALGIMSAYNEIDGAPCSANPRLLKTTLRKEWGFRGFVQSDAGAIPLLQGHGLAASPGDAVCLAIESGVDVQNYDFPCLEWESLVKEQVASGRLSMAALDRAVGSVLRVKFLLGLFENPYVPELGATEIQVATTQHKALNLRAALESIVLLKNEGGLLPLRQPIRCLAVIGPNAAEARVGTYGVRGPHAVSLLDGVRAICPPGTNVLHARGCGILENAAQEVEQPISQFSADVARSRVDGASASEIEQAVTIAAQADVTILALGEAPWVTTGEGVDRSDVGLTGRQMELAKAVIGTGKPVVVVLINDRPLSIDWLAQHAPAIIEAWFPGDRGGTAIAQVLFGVYNPGGRLPVSLPTTAAALPVHGGRHRVVRCYRDLASDITYPFGYGLSYTTFEYSGLTVTPESIGLDGEVIVAVDVTNTGSKAGDEVVQLYLTDLQSSVVLPPKRLREFKRIHLLPGESQRIHFRIASRHLSIIDAQFRSLVEPGCFEIHVGGSSETKLSARFRVEN